MRLDKFLVSTGSYTRSEAGKLCRAGKVSVNADFQKDPSVKIDPEADEICVLGKVVEYRKYTYIMLNKPEGVVSATEDGDKTVIDLLPTELQRIGLFPCGRLDKNTHGLMILTNHGELSHYLLSPKHHVKKKYKVETKFPLSESDRQALERGVDIGGYITAPCTVELVGEREAGITLTEGKYHQIKLMLSAVHNQVTYLQRVSFAEIELDGTLSEGSWRFLTENEVEILTRDFNLLKSKNNKKG
ncbi:MAG: rRNA pseudouridine synthase [Ruminococcaceae bacterium]|nr:rRNA pseudouridine synthase [Oscillospiraceae bacterium]